MIHDLHGGALLRGEARFTPGMRLAISVHAGAHRSRVATIAFIATLGYVSLLGLLLMLRTVAYSTGQQSSTICDRAGMWGVLHARPVSCSNKGFDNRRR